MHKITCLVATIFSVVLFNTPSFAVNEDIYTKEKPWVYTVQPGETIFSISQRHRVTQKSLAEFNNVVNNNIWVGQKLKLPLDAEIPADVKEQQNQQKNVKKDGQTTTSTTKTVDLQTPKSVENENIKRAVDTTKIQIIPTESDAKLEHTTFIWPSKGSIISHFGHVTNSGRLEGVNIACESGATIKASASGEVVYSDIVEGYDNVILIKHYNGFISAYGHVDALVSVGDKVKKGQVIGYVSKNKQSKRSILYFSLRKNKKSYDPEKIILEKL